MRALRLFAIVAILHVPLAQAMTSDELAMTRNVAERGYLEAIRLLHAVDFGYAFEPVALIGLIKCISND